MFILTTTSPVTSICIIIYIDELILYLLKDDIYRSLLCIMKELVTLANESGDKRLQSILVSSPFFFLCLHIHLQ